uniref:Leucine-rich repeat-containing N-terminal plant-type domain-containing protein n=2 Tax=Aegilops tauschii subsp. strangulata TaxID=200361 RepID=A0A453MQ76_AEGTS
RSTGKIYTLFHSTSQPITTTTMPRSPAEFVLLLIAAAIWSFFLVAGAGQLQPSCIGRERDALLAFKQGVSDDPKDYLGSWRQERQDCCQWAGITCDNVTGHVVELDLGQGNYLAGQISPSLLSLEHLEYLNLWGTGLCGPGGRVPEFLGSLKNLKYLDLSGMSFSGMVPPQFGNLSKLEYLDLSRIHFNNTQMVLTDISWLTRLPLLVQLDMSLINLSSIADWPLVVNKIPSLKLLRLVECSLSSANQSLTHLNLTNLHNLDLSFNHFGHPIASGWFWNLTSIKDLSLAGNYLYGPFPDALANMTSLQWLDLQDMGNKATMTVDLKNLCDLEELWLDGSLSSGNITEFLDKLPQCPSNKLQYLYLSSNNMAGILSNRMGHLTNLFWFDISYNNITGAIPLGIGNLSCLQSLVLSNNFLTGAIPLGIGNLSSLEAVYLSNNFLTGAIPLGIGNLSSLEVLYLSNNLLTGAIPLELGNCTYVYLSNNNFSGPIQLGIEHCTTLEELDLSDNNITGVIPPWLGNCTSLRHLSLSNNLLVGHVPSKITLLGNLTELALGNNNLDGVITEEHLVALKNLEHLDLSHNSFSGPMPLEFGAYKLVELTLSSNYFSGHIPISVCMLRNLLVLDLSDNLLVGELPRCSREPNLVFLLLSHNHLSGKLPSSLKNYKSLAFMDLSANNFHGKLPSWIGDLVYLRFLQLSQNFFCGDIPVTITNLKRLRQLSLAGNNISGVIPWSLSNLTAMTQKHTKRPGVDMFVWYTGYVGKFGEVWPIVMKRQELKYGKGIFNVVGMDLSLNYLTGEIPDGITSLNGLLNLNFSWNQLSEKIPGKIGAMKSLESLDLSRNSLSGEIPTSLADLTYLSSLDLSYNNLTGRIPVGRQLDTLYLENQSIYMGNIGLCGPPLERNCSGNNAPEHDNQQKIEKVSEPVLFFYFGLGSGLVAGLWVVFCTLLFKKVWRVAYFRLFDKSYDKAYVFVVVTWGRINREPIET